jgi:hypothetical protein
MATSAGWVGVILLPGAALGGEITPIQLQLGNKLPSLHILPPSRGK